MSFLKNIERQLTISPKTISEKKMVRRILKKNTISFFYRYRQSSKRRALGYLRTGAKTKEKEKNLNFRDLLNSRKAKTQNCLTILSR